jgi:hypothetical protein
LVVSYNGFKQGVLKTTPLGFDLDNLDPMVDPMIDPMVYISSKMALKRSNSLGLGDRAF